MLICHNCHTGNERRSNPDRSICLDSVCLWPIFHDIRSSYGNGNMHPLADISPKRDEDRVSTYLFPSSVFSASACRLTISFGANFCPCKAKNAGLLDSWINREFSSLVFISIYICAQRDCQGVFPEESNFLSSPSLTPSRQLSATLMGFAFFIKLPRHSL